MPTERLVDQLVSASCHEGDHASAVDILNEVALYGMEVDTYHYNCMLEAQVREMRGRVLGFGLKYGVEACSRGE